MVETWAVIVLIVGIIMGFSGAFIGLAASSVRKPMELLQERVDKHDGRIAELERHNAVREAEIKSILAGITELKTLLSKHLERS